MIYRIIIAENGKKKKIVYEGKDYETTKKKYFHLKDNNNVLMEKKTNAYKKVKPVFYEIIFLKEKEETDNIFFERDEIGRTIEVKMKTNKWSIIHKDDYFFEEKFTVYGFNKRMETKEIIKSILLKKSKTFMVKQVNYVVNKVLIHNNGDFDIIVCKNKSDARRLHNVLKEFTETNKIKGIMFTGLVGRRNRTELYKKIVEKTGWTINKVYRSSTRP